MGTDTLARKYTYQDCLNTPDNIRYQHIERVLIREPGPTTPHQSILIKLATLLLAPFVEKHDLGEGLPRPHGGALRSEWKRFVRTGRDIHTDIFTTCVLPRLATYVRDVFA